MAPALSARVDLARGGFSALLDGCEEGQPEAIEQLYRSFKAPLTQYARRLGADDPEGVADEAIFEGIEVIGTLRSRTEASFRSWLYAATRSRVASEVRRSQPATVPLLVEPTDAELGPEALATSIEAFDTLISHLSPAERDVISHRFIGGYSSAETARRLGRSDGSVRQLQHTAMKRLRFLLLSLTAAALIVVAIVAVSRHRSNTVITDHSPIDESPSPSIPDERPRLQPGPVPGPGPGGDDADVDQQPSPSDPRTSASTATSDGQDPGVSGQLPPATDDQATGTTAPASRPADGDDGLDRPPTTTGPTTTPTTTNPPTSSPSPSDPSTPTPSTDSTVPAPTRSPSTTVPSTTTSTRSLDGTPGGDGEDGGPDGPGSDGQPGLPGG